MPKRSGTRGRMRPGPAPRTIRTIATSGASETTFGMFSAVVGLDAGLSRWRPRLLGVTVGVSVFASFWVLEFVANPDPSERGLLFVVLTVYGTPLIAVAAGVLTAFRRTRPFATGLGIGVIVGLLAFYGWLNAL